MAIDLKLNGAGTTGGFAVAGGRAAHLAVQATDGSSGLLELRAAGSKADNINLIPIQLDISSIPAQVQVECSIPSDTLNDHIIEVVSDGNVVAQLAFTVIQSPRIQFDGRFQCRLSTDPDGFDHPWGQNSSFGMYAVMGPDANNPIEPPLDRIVRFHDPVALRKHAPPVGVFVRQIQGLLSDGSLAAFSAGDAVIGQPTFIGPECKFDARDGAFAQPGFEPISNFSFAIGVMFSGASDPALPRPGPTSPSPNNAPYADGFLRMDMASVLKPADFGYPDATWTARATRIPAEKRALLETENPSSQAEQMIRDRRLQEHQNNRSGIEFTLRMVERYTGLIDKNILIDSTDSPTLQALQANPSHRWYAEFFDFDSDLQCGTVWGTLG